MAAGEVLQKQLDYWQEKLSGELPALELPTDQRHPAVQTYHGSFLCSALSKKLTEALKTFSQREGVTLFATLLEHSRCCCSGTRGRTTFWLGADCGGIEPSEGLIGFFVNTLVMRTDLSAIRRFAVCGECKRLRWARMRIRICRLKNCGSIESEAREQPQSDVQ